MYQWECALGSADWLHTYVRWIVAITKNLYFCLCVTSIWNGWIDAMEILLLKLLSHSYHGNSLFSLIHQNYAIIYSPMIWSGMQKSMFKKCVWMGQAKFKFSHRLADRGAGVVVALVDVEAQWNEYHLLHNPANSSPVKGFVWKKNARLVVKWVLIYFRMLQTFPYLIKYCKFNLLSYCCHERLVSNLWGLNQPTDVYLIFAGTSYYIN